MDEEERAKLVEKLQKDVEDYVSKLKPKKYEDGWPEDRWEEEMEKHPAFMTKPVEEGQELPPLVEALQQLKYDPDVNSPDELASSYKEDGNQNFKRKKYRWAVESYTKGLEAKSENKDLNAALYVNRAAAHFHIGNFQKSLRDANQAKTLKPNYSKAIERGAISCFELRNFEDCISWCNEGLQLDMKNKTLLDLKKKATEKKKMADLEKRKAAKLESKKQKEIAAILNAAKERGIRITSKDLEAIHPAAADHMVHLDEDGKLIWPVFLLYPEYQESDFIQAFHEDTCLMSHFEQMFDTNDPPPWDEKREYVPDHLQAYFSDNEGKLVPVDKMKPLKEIICDKRYQIISGAPSFIVTISNSEFDKEYRLRNGLSE